MNRPLSINPAPPCAGTPYEMGYAHGELMGAEARGLIDGVWSYLEEQVVSQEAADTVWNSSLDACTGTAGGKC